MPIVPKDTVVTAIPWNVPAADWKLPGDANWFNPDAWSNLINWCPGKVWWEMLAKTTKEDYQFDVGEGRVWKGTTSVSDDEYTFIFLGSDEEYAGFIVMNDKLIYATKNALWRNAWSATVPQEEYYRALLMDKKFIFAVKQYRADHGICPLRGAKYAMDALREVMIREGNLT